MENKEIKFYETNIVSIMKQIAKEEIVNAPNFNSYIVPGKENIAHSTQNAYPIFSLGMDSSLDVSV